MRRTIPDYTPDGLRDFLHSLRRDVDDLLRKGDPIIAAPEVTPEQVLQASTTGQILQEAAIGQSIASGGAWLTFDSLVYQLGFDGGFTPGASTVTWPIAAVGEIQVELAWDTFAGGGKVEIVVDGLVPPWGTLSDESEGRVGSKRRGVSIAKDAAVGIYLTQASGAAQLVDAFVEFIIPDPTTGGVSRSVLKLADAVPQTPAPSTGYVFQSNLGMPFDWDGAGSLVLASTADGTGGVYVDNIITLDVTRPNGTVATYTHDSNPTCTIGEPASVRDVTSYFQPGRNVLDLTLSNGFCEGGEYGCTDIYLVRTA